MRARHFAPSLLLLVAGWALSSSRPVRAELTAALSPSVRNGARGAELVFSGTLTNTSATDKLFLNAIAATLDAGSAPYLALKSNAFFSNVPGVLLPGESYTDSEIFRIALSGAAPAGDYAGTLVLRGGANIFANTDLASASFAVLSPAVSIIASDPDASEFGPDAGAFTITRTGRTDIPLEVSFAITGTATNGTAYALISNSKTLSQDRNSVRVVITPIPNNVAEGDRTVVLALGATSEYNLGSSAAATVTIHDKPADAWRFDKFGSDANTAAAADLADPDGDGILNLVEYALNLEPKTADRSALPAPVLQDGYLTLSYAPNPLALDIAYSVEASTDFALWSTADVEAVNVPGPQPPTLRTFRYKFPLSAADKAFLRLKIVR